MKFIFIDEFKGKEKRQLYGIVLVLMDATKYDVIRKKLTKSLEKSGWDNKEEFKGKYLFCRNPVGQTKNPAQMIDLTKEIISWLSSKKLSRVKVFYAFNNEGISIENFQTLSSKIIKSISKSNSKNMGKHLASVYYDFFDNCQKIENNKAISDNFSKSLESRGFLLVESHASFVHSSNNSPGIVYADVCAALCRWVCENPEKTKCNLMDIIEHSEKEKINIVHDIYNQIKTIELVK